LGNSSAVRGLLDVQKLESPDIVFLSETKMDRKRLERFRWTLNMPNLMVKDCKGSSGGLALFWSKEVDLTIKSFSRYHIDAVVKEDCGREWRFTGIYGEPKAEVKDKTWKLMRILKNKYKKPWLVAGDFNEILFGHEKEGGQPKLQNAMENFRQTLADCGLDDLGFIGDAFTWRNHHHNANSYIRERLDRAVACVDWRRSNPLSRVINGDPRHSDHRPLIIDTGEREEAWRRRSIDVSPKFEAKWLEEEDCAERVKKAWSDALEAGACNVTEIQDFVLRDLHEWDKNVLGELDRRISKVKKELERCRRQTISQDCVSRENLLRYKLERLQEQLSTYWKQRSHTLWLTKGDRNTQFFHAFASERRRKNRIRRLKNEDGGIIEGGRLKEFIANHYQNLFLSSAGHRAQEVLRCVSRRVTSEMNAELTKEFKEEEIWEALQSIGDLKAPGPDGVPSIFYKHFWQLVGDKVKREVLAVLNGNQMPQRWNETIIVLIPKVKSPERINDLRPISLCNVLYKLIAKVLANRLKLILPEIISPTQSAFVPGRLISDNVLLAYEMTHYM
jgi:hypothetical protein